MKILLLSVIIPLLLVSDKAVTDHDEYTFMVVGVHSADGKVRLDDKFFLGRLPEPGEAVEMVYMGRLEDGGDMRFQLRVKEPRE